MTISSAALQKHLHAGKKPGSLGARLPAARPSESTHTISQWPEGLLSGSRFLILTTYSIFAAAILHLTLKNTYFTAARDHLAAAREHLAAATEYLAAARDYLAAATLLRNEARSGQ